MDTWSKQTQTKPTCPERGRRVCGEQSRTICSELARGEPVESACPERGRRVEPILSGRLVHRSFSEGGSLGEGGFKGWAGRTGKPLWTTSCSLGRIDPSEIDKVISRGKEKIRNIKDWRIK
jgi:hypothetical protein